MARDLHRELTAQLAEWDAQNERVGAVVDLDHWQRWIDSRPSTDTGYLTLAIRCMIEDLLTMEQAREITTWSLGVERRKANPQADRPEKAGKGLES